MAHVRELRGEVARLKEENSRLQDEMASLKAHFSLALVAMEDLRAIPEGGRMILVDGWNAILGARKDAHSRGELAQRWKEHLGAHAADFVWIIFDGPVENAGNEGRLRISYTGGSGPHRADRFICDYLRAAMYLGLSHLVEVRTNDRDLLKEAARLKSCPIGRRIMV
jgi:hypothetical protein